jgi:hypothetical protein
VSSAGEKAQASFVARDVARAQGQAKALQQRCKLARRRAHAALVRARLSLDRAYLEMREFDDDAADTDLVLDADHALALVVAAHNRCAVLQRRCVASAARFAAREAERFARDAEEQARLADRSEHEVRRLARKAD